MRANNGHQKENVFQKPSTATAKRCRQYVLCCHVACNKNYKMLQAKKRKIK